MFQRSKIFRSTLFFALVVMLPTQGLAKKPNPEALISQDTSITINVPSRLLTVTHRNKEVFQFPVAVGRTIYKTPIGDRHMDQIVWNPWWIPPKSEWAKNDSKTPPGPRNPLGVVKMNLGGAILLHGTSKPKSVGRLASHGCMRMHNENAETLAWWIQREYSEKIDKDLLETYRANRRKSHYIKLTKKIPVKIEYELFQMKKGDMLSHPDVYWKKGNRKTRAYQWLKENGYDKDRINTHALKSLIASSKKKSAKLSLKQLILPKTYKGFTIGKPEESGSAAMEAAIEMIDVRGQ